MKFNRWFILFVVIFLALVFVAQYRMPRKFVWTPTFSHADKQPYGCYIFDSVLSISLPHGYEVNRKTLYQMKDDTCRRGIMIVVDNMNTWGKTEIGTMISLAEKGNKILLVSSGTVPLLEDTFDIYTLHTYTNMTIRQFVMQKKSRDTLVWEADSLFNRQAYAFYLPIMESRIRKRSDSLPSRALATVYPRRDESGLLVRPDTAHTALEVPIGKGCVIVVTTPLAFTNYGILDKPNHEYVFRILSYIADLPVVRTEAYMPSMDSKEQSPLRYFLSQPPLQWAVTLAFITVLVFMVFTAKRRQRIIPEVEKPKNRNLEFVKLIGTLYYQKNDYRDLVLKKYAYFMEEMRRLLHVDLTDRSEDQRTFAVIASQTGMEEQEVSKLVNMIRKLEEEELDMNRATMESLINQISIIWKRTNQEPTSPSSQRR